jgi:hypothetical protein
LAADFMSITPQRLSRHRRSAKKARMSAEASRSAMPP